MHRRQAIKQTLGFCAALGLPWSLEPVSLNLEVDQIAREGLKYLGNEFHQFRMGFECNLGVIYAPDFAELTFTPLTYTQVTSQMGRLDRKINWRFPTVEVNQYLSTKNLLVFDHQNRLVKKQSFIRSLGRGDTLEMSYNIHLYQLCR